MSSPITVLSCIRRDNGQHQFIVALTAHALKGDRDRCIEAGMDAYISKPLRSPDLHAVLEEAQAFLASRAAAALEPVTE